jgi:FtsZ-binding cell division protein ZapB
MMDAEEKYSHKSIAELEEILNHLSKSYNPEYRIVEAQLTRQKNERNLQEDKEKQDTHKWQEHVRTVLDRTDRKTLCILVIAILTFAIAILFKFFTK